MARAPQPLATPTAPVDLDDPAAMAPFWSLRPGTHREPVAKVADVAPAPGAAAAAVPAGPLPMIEGHPSPLPSAAPVNRIPDEQPPLVATPTPPALHPALEGLQMPADDGAPRSMARPELGDWPRANPNVPTAPLDLDTMQTLIEQLAAKLHQPETAAPPVAARSSEPPPLRASAPKATPHTEEVFAGELAQTAAVAGSGQMAPYGHLALIAEAVEANRMDVCLDPILGLSDRKARHFELSVRLITGTATELAPEEYEPTAAGTGLLARIDAAKLARASDVLHRLRARGSRASLFSAVAGESLADAAFSETFAEILAGEEGRATRLVLTFAQAEARNFTDTHWRTVSGMAAIGLKFALRDVTDLDMDFERLKQHGFDFIKLDASVFLDGLPTPDGRIPAADICRHLSGVGLGLIVGGIVEERDLAKILGFGALLGQGALFGGPRSVEIERERRAA